MVEYEFVCGKCVMLGKLVLVLVWWFWCGFVFCGGFCDGWYGLVYVYVCVNYVCQKIIMLWMLGNGQVVVDLFSF